MHFNSISKKCIGAVNVVFLKDKDVIEMLGVIAKKRLYLKKQCQKLRKFMRIVSCTVVSTK